MQHNKQSPMQENYEHILMTKNDRDFIKVGGKLKTRKMNEQEEAWARAFEKYERAICKDRMDQIIEAFACLTGRYMLLSEEENVLTRIQSEVRSNPVRIESKQKHNNERPKKTGRTVKYNQYDTLDHQMNSGLVLDEDGEETERGITVSPEDGMIEALEAANAKQNRSLEKLVMDAKLSKEAKELLLAKTQRMTYEAMTYTFHGRQYMDLNYILKAPDGQLWVQDQHDRLQTLALYLKRKTSESFATHVEVYYPDQAVQIWIYQAGKRSNIEGMAIKWVS